MASAVSTEKIFSKNCLQAGIHTPASNAALICSSLGYVDLRDYSSFALLVLASKLINTASTGVSLVEIVAASDKSNTGITVIKTSGAVTMSNTNLTDYTVLECTAEEIAQLGAAAGVSLRYVAARITSDLATSLSAVFYLRADCKRPGDALTASVSA